MRLFVALPVPEEVRVALARAIEPVRCDRGGLRWTRPDGWHLTVAFLGEVEEARVGEAEEAVAAVAARHAPVALSLDGPGRFGKRVLWIGIDDVPTGAVAALGAALQQQLAAAGLPVQQRDVHAHLTLARAGRAPVEADTVTAVAVPDRQWTATELALVRSRLGDGPARYEELASAPLGG